jgi:UDP-glucose 4-epimerase
MRTVLVTGGAGFIGSHLVDQLLESGTSVRVLDNLSTGSLGNLQAAADHQPKGLGLPTGSRLEVIIGDVRDRELLRKALRGVKYVFHLAALPASAVSVTDPGDIHAVNVEGTLNLLHGALTEGVWRVVLASCSSVYGTPGTLPVGEDALLAPNTLFAASKAAAETYGRAFHARHQLDTVTLRFFSVYGPRQRPSPPATVVRGIIEALRQRRAFTDLDERSADDFIHVSDAVGAILAAARAPRAAGRVINVGSGQMISIDDVQHIVADLLKTTVPPPRSRPLGTQPYQMCARTSLASELLDFTPRVSMIAGLAHVVRSIAEEEQPERALAPAGLGE